MLYENFEEDESGQYVQVGQEHQGLLGFKVLMSMNMTAYLTAYNPNRLTISYEPTDVNVSFQDMALGNSTIPGFEEAPKDNSTMKTTLVVDQVNVLKGTGLMLLKDAAVNAIPLTLVGQVKAQAHFIGVASPVIKVCVCGLPPPISSCNLIKHLEILCLSISS